MKEMKYYIAEDGTKFETKQECLEYEDKNKNLFFLLSHTLCGYYAFNYVIDSDSITKCINVPGKCNNLLDKLDLALKNYNLIYIPKGLVPFMQEYEEKYGFSCEMNYLGEGVICYDTTEERWDSVENLIESKYKELDNLTSLLQELNDYEANL